jgi:hypothetical protein
VKDPLVQAVPAQGLIVVSLCEVDRHEDAMGALAELVTAHCSKAGLYRLAVSAKRPEALADGVEPMQAELPQPLAFDQKPVVGVPVGQELPVSGAGSRSSASSAEQEADSFRSRRTLAVISRAQASSSGGSVASDRQATC